MGKQPGDLTQDKDTYNQPDYRFYPRTLMGVKCHASPLPNLLRQAERGTRTLYRVILLNQFLLTPAYPQPDSLMKIIQDKSDGMKSDRYHGRLFPVMSIEPCDIAQYKDTYNPPGNRF